MSNRYAFLFLVLATSKLHAETVKGVPSRRMLASSDDNRGKPSLIENDDDEEDDDALIEELFKRISEEARQNKGQEPKSKNENKSSSRAANSGDEKPYNYSPSGAASARGSKSSDGVEPEYTSNGILVNPQNKNSGLVAKNRTTATSIDSFSGAGDNEIITDFNFPEVDVVELAKTMGKLTGKNFIFDGDIKGKISIVSNSSITVEKAWKVFLTALDMKGFTLVPSGPYLRIARKRDAQNKQIPSFITKNAPDSDAYVQQVFVPKYISAEAVVKTFKNFVANEARIVLSEETNAVFVTDTGSNLKKLAEILKTLDVQGFDAGIEVVPVQFASASEIAKLIDALLPGTAATGGSSSLGLGRMGGNVSSRGFSSRKTKEGGVINNILADERINSLIVHANGKGVEQVRALVKKLDQKIPHQAGSGKVHTVYLQFADAEQIASTLTNFSSSSTSGSRPGGSGGGGGTGSNPVAASLFESSIRVSADKATNALVITASTSDFITVKRVINSLDIPRNQVYVESVIMDLIFTDTDDFSVNLFSVPSGLGSIMGDTKEALGVLAGNPFTTEGAIGVFKAGQASTMTINNTSYPVSSLQGLVKALQKSSKSNVLSTPQIIALDNAEAKFESRQEIPIPQFAGGLGAALGGANPAGSLVPTVGITFKNVAISITIKPQINKSTNFVKLDLETKIGNISKQTLPQGVSNLAFATIERSTKTSVVVGDSDTIVIGGLIEDKISESSQKVPFLGDIPLLGWLFKSTSTSKTRSNLLVFLSPHIIRPYEKMRTLLDRKLKERDEFIGSMSGGEDAFKDVRNSMIQSLPDIKELSKTAPTIPLEKHNESSSEVLDKEAGTLEPKQEFVPPAANPPGPVGTVNYETPGPSSEDSSGSSPISPYSDLRS